MPDRRRPTAVFLMPVPPGEPEWHPPVDIYRGADGWLLKFDLAGVRPEDIWIQVAGCRVTVQGTRRDLLLEEGYFHYSMEITYSRFVRTVELPCTLSEGGYRADFRDGYLLIRLYTKNSDEEEVSK